MNVPSPKPAIIPLTSKTVLSPILDASSSSADLLISSSTFLSVNTFDVANPATSASIALNIGISAVSLERSAINTGAANFTMPAAVAAAVAGASAVLFKRLLSEFASTAFASGACASFAAASSDNIFVSGVTPLKLALF